MTRLIEAWERVIQRRSKRLVVHRGRLRYRYDPEADALAIILQPGATSAKTIEVDDARFVDIDSEGSPVAIEILSASAGFNLYDLVSSFGLWERETDLEIQNTPLTPTGSEVEEGRSG